MARRLAYKCWWADERDIVQEGLLAALEARDTYDERRGPWGQYAQWMAMRAMRAYLLRESSPVSVPKTHEEKGIGLMRTSIDNFGDVYKTMEESIMIPEGLVVNEIDLAKVEHALLVAIEVHAALNHYEPSGVAEASLADGVPWAAICAEHNIGLNEYKSRVMRARRGMQQDLMLQEAVDCV